MYPFYQLKANICLSVMNYACYAKQGLYVKLAFLYMHIFVYMYLLNTFKSEKSCFQLMFTVAQNRR